MVHEIGLFSEKMSMSCEGVKLFSEKLFMSREGVRLFSKKMFMSCEGVFYFMNENVYPKEHIINILHISCLPMQWLHTGKSLSEALILASTNPQYDDRLFIELQV